MSLFKVVDTKELQARKAAAEELFRGRKSGINHFADSDPETGRAVGGYVEGGIEAVLVKYAEDLIPVYLEYVARGYSLATVGVISVNASTWEIYMTRPEAQIKPLLKSVLQKVEDDYKAEVDSYNEALIAKEVAAQIAIEQRRTEREVAEADRARYARIESEVRAALTAPVKEVKQTSREKK